MTARILVVDDLLPNVMLLEARLSNEYFDVVTASGGKEAIEAVKTCHPDIIMLDGKMPDIHGFEVCKIIKSDPETMHIPIIMITALEDIEDRIVGLKAGADDFLTKPIQYDILLARLKGLVRLKQTFDEWALREKTALELGLKNDAELYSSIDHKGRILCVTDDTEDEKVITDTLSKEGHKIDVLGPGESVVDQASEKNYDLIIVNFSSNADSLRLCSRLRSTDETRQTPIILLIDTNDKEKLKKALEFGVNDYVPKPIHHEELLLRASAQLKVKFYQDYLNNNLQENLSLAYKDSLTGLYNRRYLETHLSRLFERSKDSIKPLSVIMLDIDFFKKINDKYGHDVGDEVLVETSSRLSKSLRKSDFVARMGGEEFLVVMPECPFTNAVMVAERLRQVIADQSFSVDNNSQMLDVTISLGVAASNQGVASPEELMKLADDRLYKAKESGRNRVISHFDAQAI